jgi:hypothetical protein
MSRPRGFSHADIDTGFLSDPKVRAVRRRLGSAGQNAILCYLAVVLECWRIGERLRLGEALPDWLEPAEGTAEALRAEGLLDRQLRIPAGVWDDWYGVADARREQRRSAGAAGGTATAQRRSSGAGSNGAAALHQTDTHSSQTDTADSTNRQSLSSRARARGSGKPESIKILLPPPPGYPEGRS